MRNILIGLLAAVLVTGATGVLAKARIYKWVKDKEVSSGDVLTKTQASRVVTLSERRALEAVRRVMTEDLYLVLAEYHDSRHRQDAETTPDSVLPEAVVGQEDLELADEDYRFLLQVRLKAYGGRTRVLAEAYPVYRVRDYDKEAELDEDGGGGEVEIKVRADEHQAVAVGPIFVAPVPGRPGRYGAELLPDAAERAGDLVKSFVYFLDRRIRAGG